jgi:hypothetical protein
MKSPPASVLVSVCSTCGRPITAEPVDEHVPTVCPHCPARKGQVKYFEYGLLFQPPRKVQPK